MRIDGAPWRRRIARWAATATVMAAFWLGTVPLMAAVGLGAQRLLGRFRTRLPVVTASVLVILGVLTVAGRFTPAQAAHASSSDAAHVHHAQP